MSAFAIAIGAIGLTAGTLIGCVGVGGILVVPALVYGLRVPIQDAIASAMLGYLFTGIIGTIIYAREGSIRWKLAGPLCLGTIPGVLFGAWATSVVSPVFLQAGIGLLALSSSLNGLLGASHAINHRNALPLWALLLIGLVTGVISGLTGTGGPLVLVPLLIWLRLPTLEAVGISQTAQIPIAFVGTTANLMFNSPDLAAGTMLAIALAIGALFGAKLAHIAPRRKLSHLASFLLFLIGFSMLACVAYRQFFEVACCSVPACMPK